jgi:hypothetical protein
MVEFTYSPAFVGLVLRDANDKFAKLYIGSFVPKLDKNSTLFFNTMGVSRISRVAVLEFAINKSTPEIAA